MRRGLRLCTAEGERARAHRPWAKATEVQVRKGGNPGTSWCVDHVKHLRDCDTGSFLLSALWHAGGRGLVVWCWQGNELQQRGLSPAVLDVAPGKGEVTRTALLETGPLLPPVLVKQLACWLLHFSSHRGRLSSGSHWLAAMANADGRTLPYRIHAERMRVFISGGHRVQLARPHAARGEVRPLWTHVVAKALRGILPESSRSARHPRSRRPAQRRSLPGWPASCSWR